MKAALEAGADQRPAFHRLVYPYRFLVADYEQEHRDARFEDGGVTEAAV
jgi:hypothetical protein